MGKLILFVLERFPLLEVLVRCLLWKFPSIKQGISDAHTKDTSSRKKTYNLEKWEEVKKTIIDYNIKRGDLLLVHSSMDGLSEIGISAKEIIDFLLDTVGEEGTLVFAAYPKCRQYDDQEDVLFYDPSRSISWTGMLPNVFCKYKGVVRSEFPYNTLAAKGPLAEEMMKDNLKGDTSQGKYSSWKYCVDHHAKILYLGVSAALSCTMMNYPEDALEENWYVKDWYYEQKYVIKKEGQLIEKTIKERHPEWYRFYAMFNSEYWMKKNGYLSSKEIDGVYIGVTEDMHELAERLLHEGMRKKSVYRIPKKYWK